MLRDPLGPVFRALVSPVRRRMLDRLRVGPRSTGALCAGFRGHSRLGLLKHLAVLRAAGLVIVEAEGRRRINRLNVVPLQALAERWMRPFEALWASGLLRLQALAERGSPEPWVPSEPPRSPRAAPASARPRVARRGTPPRGAARLAPPSPEIRP